MSLDVLMHGEKVGALFVEAEGAYSLAYDEEAVERFGAGTVLLSMALPVRGEPYGPEETRAYVEGLLPQGERRVEIAGELGLDPSDGYGLIAELGGDCLGAVGFLREGEEVEPCDPDSVVWLDEDELEEIVQAPPGELFEYGPEQRLRFTLPGHRHKLALVRDEANDRWAWPEPGLPSTHIVKPEPAGLPGIAANEAACSTAYREIGLPVAHTAFEEIAGTPCLVSKRFDRWGDGAGAERLHQESLTQALGVEPDAEEGRLAAGAPTLAEASHLMRSIGEERAAATLMTAAFCDLVIGDTEPRGGGAGLLFGDDGPMLAPLYDIVSTEVYGATRRRPLVTGVDVPPAPFLIDLAHAIQQCGFEFQPSIIEATRVMGTVSVALGAVATRADEEGWYRRAIDEAVQLAVGRVLGFREESEYLRPAGAE